MVLTYTTYGFGDIPLLAFHGFGRKSSDFEVFTPLFGEKYTLFSFNLFHHEDSEYPAERIEENQFTKKEFEEIFKIFFRQLGTSQVAVMGYSLGGKIALLFAEIFPEKIESLWLFAPDGIKKNIWYTIASGTTIGRCVYKYFLENPQLFFKMVNGLRSARLINDKIKKFALNNMTQKHQREQVYKVWLTFKNTNPNMRICIRNCRHYNFPVYQFYGRNDKVIPPKIGKKFSKKIKQKRNFHVIPAGHQLLTAQTCRFIEQLQIVD